MNPFLLWSFLNALEESGSAVSGHFCQFQANVPIQHCIVNNMSYAGQASRLDTSACTFV